MTKFVTTEDNRIFVDLDAVIEVGQNTYDLACERTVEEARLAASFTELFRKYKRDCKAQIAAEKMLELQKGTPLLGEADPELERLLAEEEEIERRIKGEAHYPIWRHRDGSVRTEHMDCQPGDYYGTFNERGR